MSTRPYALSALAFVLCLHGCGRIGYDLATDAVIEQSATDPEPFGGAESSAVDVDEHGARLGRVPGFVSMPASLPAATAGAAACPVGEDVIVAGGSDTFPAYGTCASSILRYEPTGELLVAGDLALPNQGFALYHDAGDVHSVMGYCGGSLEDEANVLRLPPAGAPPELIGSFPEGAYHFASGIVPDAEGVPNLLVAGGYGSGPLLDHIQVMDDNGDARLLTARLATARCMSAHAVVDGVLFVIGGNQQSECTLPPTTTTPILTDEIVAVSLTGDTADVVAHLPEPLAAGCAVVRYGKILVFGGVRYASDGSTTLTRELSSPVYYIKPGTGEVGLWGADLPQPRAAMACAATDEGQVLLFGGVGAGLVSTSEILAFDPLARTGWITGAVADSRVPGARWTKLILSADTPEGTAIAMAVRISDDPTALASGLGWTDLAATGLLPEDLDRGRYLQWRATLTTTVANRSPVLNSVELQAEM